MSGSNVTRPTSPPYVGKELTALFHTQPLLTYSVYSIAALTTDSSCLSSKFQPPHEGLHKATF